MTVRSPLRFKPSCGVLFKCAVFTTCFLLWSNGGRAIAADLHADQWLRNPLQWSFQGNVVHCSGRNAGLAVLQAMPISKRVSIEADVEVAKVVGALWRLVGVAIVNDGNNFWHLALVWPPASQEQRPFLELHEMRDGIWGAQGNLQPPVRDRTSEAWQLGQHYRLRIALDPQGIEGVVADRQGRAVERVRYTFSGEAVKSGRPALRCEGFAATFAAITTVSTEPVDTTPPAVAPYQSDSFVKEIGGKRTGFFHVERQGNTWWAVDPLGRGFVPLGVDHASFHGHGCEKLGYAPYGRKNQAKYGSPAPWATETLDRLRAWGFNLLGAGCSTELRHRGLAHTEFLAIGSAMAGMGDAMNIMPDRGVPGSAFPNVFHPDFEAFCRYRASQDCPSHANDPWLFGYFLDNELAWWGQHWDLNTGLFDAVMTKSADHTAKRALRDFLAKRYDNNITRFNQAWGVRLESFDNILQHDSLAGPRTETVAADKKAFVALIADRYFGTITRAIRDADPNHMILGCRFASGYASDVAWQAAGRHCDIVTFNYYGNVDLDKGIARDDTHARQGKPLVKVFEKFYDAGQRPMMVTEWSFPALDGGVPSIHGAGQRFRTQAQRTKATEITARTMLALPFLIGYDYFMWVDEPALGVSAKFPEDSNYGLVNEDGKPYELLTAVLTGVHRDAGRLRRQRPDRAGTAIGDSSPAPSALALFLAKPVASAAGSATPHPALRFERHGKAFLATNGPLEICGRIDGGGLTDEVRHRGLVMGRFNGMVQQFTTRDEWPEVGRLVDVRATVGPLAMTLDLVGRYEAPPQSGRQSFEIAYRLTLPPESDWFAAQLLWCRNTSNRPMSLRGILFRLDSRIGGSAADDVPASLDAPPRLWGGVEGDAWLDEKAGAFWGLATDDADPLKINFWLDAGKQQHPDATLELERSLAPDETYRPATPVGVLCVAGRGDRLQWQSQARQAPVARLPLIPSRRG